MNYHHLSIEERSCIRKYYVDGLSYREIARLIGRNVSTVSREIRRNCTHMYDIPTYYPHTAQKKYLLRRSYCHRGMFHSQEVIDYINEKLEATWSPEQIACTPCELKMPSWRTIYRWIYEKYLVNGNLTVISEKLSRSIAEMSEKQTLQIAKSMFRYAVEMELIMRMFSEITDFTPSEIEEMRKEAIRNVRRTRGKVRLDDLFKRKDTQSL